jgi:hypothetical protein
MSEVYYNNYNNSKYTYTINEIDSEVFVFEIILKKFNNKNKIIRKIIKNKKGNVISLLDNIIYENIDSILLTAININNPTQELSIHINIDQSKKYDTFINSLIYIELFSNNNYLECNYHFLNKNVLV